MGKEHAQAWPIYERELKRSKVLPKEELILLVKKAQLGDQRSLDKVVRANLRFVVGVARKFRFKGVPDEDLVAEGNAGLLKAVECFDASRGVTFLSYAVWWIRQSMLRAIQEKHIVHIPVNVQDKVRKVLQELGRHATEADIRDHFKWNKETCTCVCDSMNGGSLALDAPANQDDLTGGSFRDVVASEEATQEEDLIVTLQSKRVMDYTREVLSEREFRVLHRYYRMNGEDRHVHLAEIAEELAVSRERVRQIRDAALRKLRAAFRTKGWFSRTSL